MRKFLSISLAFCLLLMLAVPALAEGDAPTDEEPVLVTEAPASETEETAAEDAAAAEIVFTDVAESAWYYNYVTDLAGTGIINGFGDGTYRPDDTLTWAQSMKLLLCSHGDLAYVIGSDVEGLGMAIAGADDAYAVGADWEDVTMGKAVELGLCDEAQSGAAEITRLDFCKVAAQLFVLTGTAEAFPDCDDPDVLALVDAGVINGFEDGTFRPDAILTRAQIAKIIWLLIK